MPAHLPIRCSWLARRSRLPVLPAGEGRHLARGTPTAPRKIVVVLDASARRPRYRPGQGPGQPGRPALTDETVNRAAVQIDRVDAAESARDADGDGAREAASFGKPARGPSKVSIELAELHALANTATVRAHCGLRRRAASCT